MIVFLAILGSVAAFMLAISLIPSKSPLKTALEQLAERPGLRAEDARIRSFERLFSKESRGKLAKKLIEAGWYTVTPGMMGARIVGAAFGGFALMVVLFTIVIHLAPPLAMLLIGAGTVGAAWLPMSMLERAAEARKTAVQKALPDFLDMVATTVQAGLSINAALGYALDAAPGPLGDEIKAALSEIRLGRARSEALKAAADRLQQQSFTTTVTAITQAERLGTNISKVLGELSEDVRNHRITVVEELAAKMPVKMVFPMALFMLPAIFVIIFGALAANYFAQPK